MSNGLEIGGEESTGDAGLPLLGVAVPDAGTMASTIRIINWMHAPTSDVPNEGVVDPEWGGSNWRDGCKDRHQFAGSNACMFGG
jgi:hypothetical protein